MTADPTHAAIAGLRASATALLTAAAVIPEGRYAWIAPAAADALELVAEVIGSEPVRVREVLSHGLRDALGRVPHLSGPDARDIAKGIAGLYSAIRGWTS